MLDYRIPIVIVYIFCCIVFCCQNTLCIKKFVPKKLITILGMIRLFPYWKLFIGMGPMSFDIKITAQSNQNIYEWSLRKDKNICGINLFSDISRITLTFYYETYCSDFLNNYLLRSTESLLKEKKEYLNEFIVQKIVFDSYHTENIDNIKTLFRYSQ